MPGGAKILANSTRRSHPWLDEQQQTSTAIQSRARRSPPGARLSVPSNAAGCVVSQSALHLDTRLQPHHMDARLGLRPLHLAELFLNAACSSCVAVLWCRGRSTCKLNPEAFIARQAVVLCTSLPVCSLIHIATFGAVHRPPSGAGPRSAFSKALACCPLIVGFGPGVVFH